MLIPHSADEISYLLALRSLKGIGNVRARNLLDHFSCAENLFRASRQSLLEFGLKSDTISQIENFNFDLIYPTLQWAEQRGRSIIALGSPLYPPLLAQINNPPLLLFVLGDPGLLNTPQIALVGTRRPTVQGIHNTQAFSRALCDAGLAITSGLALGIDGEAHRAALAANGHTIAVMATGLNRVSPSAHRLLAHQIANHGVLVSEKLPDEAVDKGSFPQRNRIIAGLSLGTLVIEAAQTSGSLITANLALDEGREVWAIPGSIHSPQSKGCHQLIKQGGKLVESLQDILEDIGWIKAVSQQSRSALPMSKKPVTDPDLKQLLDAIDYQVTPLDTILQRTQLTVETLTHKLLHLELEGWIINSAGGYHRQ